MSETNDKILDALYKAIDELNLTLPPDKRVAKAHDAPLASPGGPLDSMGQVNLVVEAEQQIEDAFGTAINLADEQAATAAKNPLADVKSLADYIEARLDEAKTG